MQMVIYWIFNNFDNKNKIKLLYQKTVLNKLYETSELQESPLGHQYCTAPGEHLTLFIVIKKGRFLSLVTSDNGYQCNLTTLCIELTR